MEGAQANVLLVADGRWVAAATTIILARSFGSRAIFIGKKCEQRGRRQRREAGGSVTRGEWQGDMRVLARETIFTK